jgi:hypothetical protein
VSAAGLGFNVMSAAMQPLGFTQSIVRVGATWVGRGIARTLASPLGTAKMVNEKSEFMRNRARTRFREINELRNKVQDENVPLAVAKQGTYFLMMRAQQIVDIPTWVGAYEKAIADQQPEDRAVALADQAVIDAQGGGQFAGFAAQLKGKVAQPPAPKISMPGARITVQQDFRKANPDNVALLFKRDLARGVERRVGARYAGVFGG